ncbi:MAG TPA: helix-hairpin-helix domain-containing protein [Acidobacteriota bacterium]|jgi:competence protein ComEA
MKNTIRFLALALSVALTTTVLSPALQAQKSSAPAAKATRHVEKKAAPAAAVSINSGGPDQLAKLPGVGDSTARRIVEFRSKNGPFKRVEDLMAVKGIGEKKFLKLKSHITL